jgi:dTDP-4-dehydrorhamnose reductase
VITEITRTGQATHPILEGKGWWQRENRWIKQADFAKHLRGSTHATPVGRPVLITGATGTLGKAFAHLCTGRGIAYRLVGRKEMDITDPAQIRKGAPGNKAVGGDQRGRVRESRRSGTRIRTVLPRKPPRRRATRRYLPRRGHRVPDVFLGPGVRRNQGGALRGKRPGDPGGVYGASKAAAEKDVLALLPSALIIRTSAFFGPWDEYNFATIFLRRFAASEPFDVAAHLRVSPTYVVDLVHASLDLLLDGAAGIWHLANRGDVSWADFARLVALKAGLPEDQVQRWYDRQVQNSAGLPVQSTVLSSQKAWLMPPLEHAVDRYLRDSTVLQKLLQEA